MANVLLENCLFPDPAIMADIYKIAGPGPANMFWCVQAFLCTLFLILSKVKIVKLKLNA